MDQPLICHQEDFFGQCEMSSDFRGVHGVLAKRVDDVDSSRPSIKTAPGEPAAWWISACPSGWVIFRCDRSSCEKTGSAARALGRAAAARRYAIATRAVGSRSDDCLSDRSCFLSGASWFVLLENPAPGSARSWCCGKRFAHRRSPCAESRRRGLASVYAREDFVR